jgi:MoxR-like ATPase
MGAVTMGAVTMADTVAACRTILDEVERAIVGKRDVLELVLLGILADGHVLLEDVPGLGKTIMARSFATVLGLDFRRVQFTPDLLPADVTGANIYNQRDAVFEFRAGPIFTNLLLADEINRTPPKTQAALLEAMAERQVTVEGETRKLPTPFVVIATDNPIEYEGTYPLPEAQLDRFLLRTALGYLPAAEEVALLARRIDRRTEIVELRAVSSPAEVVGMRASVEEVYVAPDVLHYIVALLTATRGHPSVSLGASPRGGLALLALARGRAMLAGREYVSPEDVKAVAVPALAHRLTLRPELWVRQISAGAIVTELLEQVPTPATLRAP